VPSRDLALWLWLWLFAEYANVTTRLRPLRAEVHPGTAVQDIASFDVAPVQAVVSIAAADVVHVAATLELAPGLRPIVPALAVDLVISPATLNGVRTVSRRSRGIAWLLTDGVRTREVLRHDVAPYLVLPQPAVDRVIAIVAVDPLVPHVTVQPWVVAGAAGDGVVAEAAFQRGQDHFTFGRSHE